MNMFYVDSKSTGDIFVDVMIDAIVAEKCKLHPAFASDLQSLCWGAMAAFSIIGYATSGLMIKYLGPIGTFGVLVASSLLILFPALAGFLGEPRKTKDITRDGPRELHA